MQLRRRANPHGRQGADPPEAPTSAVRGPGGPAQTQEPGHRADRAFSFPLGRLFAPEPDPTERYPGQSAEVEGYVVAPEHAVTLAVTAESSKGIDLLDSIWSAFRRKGIGVRHLTVLNDRGRIVSLMTLRVHAAEETIRLVQSLLVVPVRGHDGLAEVHLLATPEEAAALGGQIAGGAAPAPPAKDPALPPARETGPLRPEDWAFLGLLSAVGALDGAEAPPPTLVAEALGIDAAVFAERAQRAQRGLEGVVTGLFAPAPTESGPMLGRT